MSISFPISLPTSPSFKRLEFREVNVVGVAESPTTFEQQVYEWDGDRWEVGVTYPIMNRAYGDPVTAAISSLRGRRGTILIGNPKSAAARGTATGTPFVKATQDVRGVTLATSGWTPNITGIMKAGDHFQIAKNQLTMPSGIDNAAWSKTQCTVAANTQTAPDGTATAERVTPDALATDVQVFQSVTPTVVAGRTYTFYIWMRAALANFSLTIFIQNQASTTRGSQVCAVTTSWQLFSVTATMGASDTGLIVLVGGGSTWVVAEGAVDMWGASLVSPTVNARLHKVVADADSDANGDATFDIWPKLRESTLDRSLIIVSSPKGEFRLASNRRAYSIDEAGNYTVAFELVEAL